MCGCGWVERGWDKVYVPPIAKARWMGHPRGGGDILTSGDEDPPPGLKPLILMEFVPAG